MKFLLGYSFLAVILFSLNSCTDKNKPQKQYYYFDLEGFFEKEAVRLQHRNSEILKSVSHNGIREDKKLKISNWNEELELFMNSDINKAAWKTGYNIRKTGNLIIYNARDSSFKTRRIEIEQSPEGKVSRIRILSHVKNYLYTASDQLDYKPNEGYSISKNRKVLLLGKNNYKINGKFITNLP